MRATKYRILLVVSLSIWMVSFPTYVHSYNLTQADFLARPHWENRYQEGLLAGLSKKWEILGWHVFARIYGQDHRFFELLGHLSFPRFCPAEKTLILRC